MNTIEIVSEKPMQFPTLTICDSNGFTTKYAQELILNTSISYYGLDIKKMSFSNYSDYAIKNLSKVVKSLVNYPEYGDEVRQRLGFNLDQTLFSCEFTQITCILQTDFRWYFHYDFGNCFQYNWGQNNAKNVSFGSKLNGLSLVIGPVLNQNFYPLTFSTGL